MSKIEFIVKAKSDFADVFRRTFGEMSADFSEEFLDDACSVVVFKVKCDPSKVELMKKHIPLTAYASIALTGSPPLNSR